MIQKKKISALEEYIRQCVDDIWDYTSLEKPGGENPKILKCEEEYAIKRPKNNKNPGPYEIHLEVSLLIDDENQYLLSRQLMWNK